MALAARAFAQGPGRTPVVGYWGFWHAQGSPPDPATRKDRPRIAWFEEELAKHGFVAEKNVRIVYRFTGFDTQHLIASQARELVAGNPEVIYARHYFVREYMEAVRALTKTVPIVFDNCAEDVATRRVGGDLKQPAGNVTGVALKYAEFAQKRLELVRELLPKAKRVAVVGDYREVGSSVASLEETARRVGLELVRGDVSKHGGGFDATADRGIAALEVTLAEVLRARPDALMAFGIFNALDRAERFLDFELRHRIPFVDDGLAPRSVVGFGMDYTDHFKQAVAVIAKILKGARPADIPVESTSRYLLTVNLQRAREIGVTIPPAILVRADKITPDPGPSGRGQGK